MNENFNEDMQEVYSKTLKLAFDLAHNKSWFTNSPPSSKDKKFLKNIYKGYTDFQDLTDRKKKIIQIKTPSIETRTLSPLKHNKTEFLPKDSGKQKLNSSLKERKNFVSGSRAGKPGKYAIVGPGILEKLKISASINQEESFSSQNTERTSLPHVSIRTGRAKPALELPSFKDYVKSERSKDFKDIAFDKINRCQKQLEEFKKEMTGLEIFVHTNPGVGWNNDKRVLLKLSANPNQKYSIIRAYNESVDKNRLKKEGRKNKFRHTRLDSQLSKTPGPDNKFYFPETTKYSNDPATTYEKCLTQFQEVRESQNKNLINIMDSLKAHRPVLLSEKAKFILNDTEKFRDRGYSLRKMEEIKKIIDKNQVFRLKKSMNQVGLYDNIMEFLKRKNGGPNDTEINFVEIIKEVLEEGWYIEDEILNKITESLDPTEIKELQPLLEFIRVQLENFTEPNE